jgi:hypothetical protein
MLTESRWPWGTFAGMLLMVVSCGAAGQSVPTAMELVQLPKFCYGKLNIPNATGPEYNLPPECGPGTNHYCSGLIHLIRAKASGNRNKTISELGQAEGDIRYTEEWIRGYPNCSIRDQVAKSRAEVNGLMTAYGMKPGGKK